MKFDTLVQTLLESREPHKQVIVDSDGHTTYYTDRVIHRDNGPAYIDADGTQKWFINGQLHREDGPAVIYSDGDVEWWLDDLDYTEEEFKGELQKRRDNMKKQMFNQEMSQQEDKMFDDDFLEGV